MENNNISQIRDLINKLNYYTKKYDEGNPEINDKEWDNMYFELQDLENRTGLYFEDSPTQKVIFQEVNKLNKVEHNHPMLSLDKTKSIDAIKSFIGNKDCICMAKMDGLTCSLRYLDGKLVSAETRGNGVVGEDILHNALQVKNIPNKINYKDELIVDGEIICTYKDFEPFAAEYKNPRNFASGSIRLLNSKESASRNLTFVAWDVIKGLSQMSEELGVPTLLTCKLAELNKLGFTVVPFHNCNKTDMEDFNSEYNRIGYVKQLAQNAQYPIDGLVFKYNNCDEYEEAGRTDHHFKGGLAYKFYDEEYETTLLDIIYDVSRFGQLTPVAVFEPIEIEGTLVEKASLHNLSVMEELLGNTPYIGQKIWVIKSNQIIPQIVRSEKRRIKINIIEIPKTCPICQASTIIKDNNGVKTLWCSNEQCNGRLVNKICNFFGKKGLDAKGISKATLEKLIEWGWIKRLQDVFELQQYEKEWKNIRGFGEKSVSNILQSISECTNCNLESVISAAGIPLIGRSIAKTLSKRFSSYDTFKEAVNGSFNFSEIDGFGFEMNKSLKTFDYSEIDFIVKKYLKITNNVINDNKNTDRLKNLIFCITGKLNKYKNREELVRKIEENGGKTVSSMSKKVNYLINNDINSQSSKNVYAKNNNIEILTEEELDKKFFMD